jgi:ATP-dependent DNA ligase
MVGRAVHVATDPLVRVPGPFDRPDWLFELKHDGFRALAHVAGHRSTLVFRRRYVYKQDPMLLDEIAHSRAQNEAGGITRGMG